MLLNGELVIDNVPLPGIPARDRIALQHYGAPVQFSSILVRESKWERLFLYFPSLLLRLNGH